MAPAKRAEKEKKNLGNCILRRTSCGYNEKSINTHTACRGYTYVHINIYGECDRMQTTGKGYGDAQSGTDLGPQWPFGYPVGQQSSQVQSNTILTVMWPEASDGEIDMATEMASIHIQLRYRCRRKYHVYAP